MAEERNGRITLTIEELKELVGARGGESPVVRVEPAQQLTEEEAFAKALRRDTADRTPPTLRREPRVTEDGVRFTAVIAPSRRYKAGIVVNLEDYQYPEDAETKVAKDGQTPNGLQIKKPNGEYTQQFKQWRWVTFYQRDLKAYVGRDASLLPRASEQVAAE